MKEKEEKEKENTEENAKEKEIPAIQRREVYLIIIGVVLFAAGFLVSSLINYSPGAKEGGELYSSPVECGKPSQTQEPLLLWNLTGESSVSKEEMGSRTLAYMAENFLKPQGIEGELVAVKEYGKNLYVVDLTLNRGDTTQQISVYVSKDGKLILLGEGGGIVDLPESGETLLTPTVPQPTPTPTQQPQKPTIDTSDAAYVTGPENATVTMIEFNDYQCPFCKKFRDQTLDQVLGQYGEKIKYVLMDFPLTSIHPQAFIAHVSARCAGEQDKYFEYHDKLFANQGVWSRFAPDSEDELNELNKYASELGLDSAAFNECLDSTKYAEAVLSNMQKGVNAGVTGTPAFFINGIKIGGARPYQDFQQLIDAELGG
ncbi:MAG: thioredoxin domain-containing protein [Candidatus Hydrothermarchaeales archaeon]